MRDESGIHGGAGGGLGEEFVEEGDRLVTAIESDQGIGQVHYARESVRVVQGQHPLPDRRVPVLRAHASWGYFDYRMTGERFDDGYQSMPVNWTISSPRKREFFELVERVTGASTRD